MKTVIPTEPKTLTEERYYLVSDEDVLENGINRKGFEFTLTNTDLIKLFAQKRRLVLNLDGEYAVILKFAERPHNEN